MAGTLFEQLMAAHLVEGQLRAGQEVAISIDQVLTQDAFGTLIYLEFEAMGLPRVMPLTVSYADHNVYGFDAANADDHRFIASAARRYGAYFSRPGNGICHQVHGERFTVPGQTLLGSDSHTTTAGGLGMLAFGAGGLDVAVAMGGGPYRLTMPQVLGIELRGALQPWATAKDVILTLLAQLTVKGGVGKVLEFCGPGVAALTVPERCTIANMATEIGATTALFPSDARTRDYLRRAGREASWQPLVAAPGADYDEMRVLDLASIEPMVALPGMPDRGVPVREAAGLKVQQVLVGSCTNGSFTDLAAVAAVLKGRRVHPEVTMIVAPASRQALELLVERGEAQHLLAAGASLSESTCGACIGMGHVPAPDTVSLRTFNRNFTGRSGLADDRVLLASPQVAAVAAIYGELRDPRTLGEAPPVELAEAYNRTDVGIVPPLPPGVEAPLVRGPNIVPLPRLQPLPSRLQGPVLSKLGDDVTTDDIMPAGTVMSLWSNIPRAAEYTLRDLDPAFVARAKNAGRGFIVAGANYGQGSSREHAALCPRYLGVQAVLAKSFARIHEANLVNFGIVPLTFADPADYERVVVDDELEVVDWNDLASGVVRVRSQGGDILAQCSLSSRERSILQAGGLLAYTAAANGKKEA